MHRDIKADNILCSMTDGSNLKIKLADFGFATKFDNEKKNNASIGTSTFMAPEICNKEVYDEKIDVWAVGILYFLLLSG